MLAQVGLWVGVDSALDEGQAQRVAPDVVPVLAVVEQRHAVVTLGEVGPLVRARFEARPVPVRVPVCGPLHVAPLDVERRAWSIDRDRERGFEQGLALAPGLLDDFCCGQFVRRVVDEIGYSWMRDVAVKQQQLYRLFFFRPLTPLKLFDHFDQLLLAWFPQPPHLVFQLAVFLKVPFFAPSVRSGAVVAAAARVTSR